MKNLNLKEVKECFELYKVAFNKKPYVSNLAKELGVKTTTLMKFIVENDKHFQLYTDKQGTYISQVYVELKDREGTDEYVEYNKQKYKNTIFLKPVYYDYTKDVAFHYVPEDEKDDKRSSEWRNTSDKMTKIKQYLGQNTFTGGGIGDSYTRKYDNYLSKENIKLLMSQGWQFVNYNEKADE